MTNQSSITRAICTSFLGLIAFYLINFLIVLIVGGVLSLLAQIPFLYKLISWLLYIDTGSQDWLLTGLAPVFAYFITLAACRKLSKIKETADLACTLLGAYLLIINVISLVLNLIYGNSVWVNLTYAIAGIVFIARKSADVTQ